jgi:hypothetical protein
MSSSRAWKGNGPKLQLRARIMLSVDSLSFLIRSYECKSVCWSCRRLI